VSTGQLNTWSFDNRPLTEAQQHAVQHSYKCEKLKEQFRARMRVAGIKPPEILKINAGTQRFHIEGDHPGSKNGWYVLLDGLDGGSFGAFGRLNDTNAEVSE
jgi:hypothetical protein